MNSLSHFCYHYTVSPKPSGIKRNEFRKGSKLLFQKQTGDNRDFLSSFVFSL